MIVMRLREHNDATTAQLFCIAWYFTYFLTLGRVIIYILLSSRFLFLYKKVRHGVHPYMEYYESEAGPSRDPPINSISLSTCHSVTSHPFDKRHENTFCLHLEDRILTLVASSANDMDEW